MEAPLATSTPMKKSIKINDRVTIDMALSKFELANLTMTKLRHDNKSTLKCFLNQQTVHDLFRKHEEVTALAKFMEKDLLQGNGTSCIDIPVNDIRGVSLEFYKNKVYVIITVFKNKKREANLSFPLTLQEWELLKNYKSDIIDTMHSLSPEEFISVQEDFETVTMYRPIRFEAGQCCVLGPWYYIRDMLTITDSKPFCTQNKKTRPPSKQDLSIAIVACLVAKFMREEPELPSPPCSGCIDNQPNQLAHTCTGWDELDGIITRYQDMKDRITCAQVQEVMKKCLEIMGIPDMYKIDSLHFTTEQDLLIEQYAYELYKPFTTSLSTAASNPCVTMCNYVIALK